MSHDSTSHVNTGGGDFIARDKIVHGDEVHGDKHIHEAPRPVVAALHQLPAPVADFTGRDDERASLLRLVRAGGRAAIGAVHGLGGIGKTELARCVADDLRADFPDAQLWLDLHGADVPCTPPEQALAQVIRAFHGPDVRLPDRLEELAAIYRQCLDGQRALVVLDNAADSEQIRPLLPPAGCAVLVTSRVRLALPGLTLEALQPEPASDLLRTIAPRTGDQAAAIARLCGYLPLALRAAGSLLAVSADLDPAAYARSLADERQRLATIGTEGVPLGVEASLGLSYRRLEPGQRAVLHALAVFPASFDAAAAEAVAEDAGHRQTSALLRLSLVQYDETTARYRLHDLVRLFAQGQASAEERAAAAQRHAAHYTHVGAQADELYLAGGEHMTAGLALFDRERAHIEAAFAWAKEHDPALLLDLVDAVAPYLGDLRFYPRQRIAWLEAQAEAARAVGHRQAEGAALGNLGLAYADLGDARRAIGYHEQALAIDRDIGDRRGEGADLGNLGLAYAALGDARRAIEYDEQSLRIKQEIGDRRGEANSITRLGLAYAALGETRQAINYYEKALPIYRDLGDRRGEGADLGNLGLAYADLGDARRAIEYYEQHLAIAREIGDRRGEGNALGGLGVAYKNLGDARRSIEYMEQVLAIMRDIGNRRGEGNALWNLSLALDSLGDRIGALARAREALAIYEQIESPYADSVRQALAAWDT